MLRTPPHIRRRPKATQQRTQCSSCRKPTHRIHSLRHLIRTLDWRRNPVVKDSSLRHRLSALLSVRTCPKTSPFSAISDSATPLRRTQPAGAQPILFFVAREIPFSPDTAHEKLPRTGRKWLIPAIQPPGSTTHRETPSPIEPPRPSGETSMGRGVPPRRRIYQLPRLLTKATPQPPDAAPQAANFKS